jgi:alcohol dehydrogenase class IV
MSANVTALRIRAPREVALGRYDDVARLLTGRADATAADGIAWIRGLVGALGIPPLRTYGITRDDVSGVVDAAQKASSMKANPLALTDEELRAILGAAL